jgi:hypothetical protein
MHIINAELQRISTFGGLVLGTSDGGGCVVDGITAASSNNIGALLSLTATGDNAQILFANTASTFNSLVAQADNGVLVQVDVTTDIGVLTLDGDADNSSTEDSHNKIALDGARTLSAKGQMTLDSTRGGIVRSGAYTLTLKAEAGILINDDFSGASSSSGQELVINADANDSGSGTFSIKSGKWFSSSDGVLTVTSADIQLQGELTSGTAVTNIHTTALRTIGIGTISEDMDIEATELQRLTASGLVVGADNLNKGITVVGFTEHTAMP